MACPRSDAPCLGQLDAHLTALGIRGPGFPELEVSAISGMPPGRKPVKTVWFQPHEREEA